MAGITTPNVGTHDNYLNGVAATSASNAWSVGDYSNGTALQTLVLHWNGTAWKHVTSPNPGGSANDDVLDGVAATSRSNAWAVGYYVNGSVYRTLILRWNGTAWKHVPSPNPGGSNGSSLYAVSAVSSSDAWAVGDYSTGSAFQTLTLHWRGTSWKQVPSPSPGGSSYPHNFLFGVASVSSNNAWAVGSASNSTTLQTLVLHWNGTAWKHVTSPNPAGSGYRNELVAVTIVSSTNVWAVGHVFNGSVYQTLVLRWNGTAWKHVTSPNPGGSSHYNELLGVAATSASNVWAVGYFSNGTSNKTLILRRSGSSWKRATSPNPGMGDTLNGVAATSSTNAWAAGDYLKSSVKRTLVERWNGTSWKLV